MGPEKKPIDCILIHLAFVNAIIICTKGSIDIITFFHLRNFLGNISCKMVMYLARVARGLSICTTCLLSVVQAITISPRTSPCRKFQPRSAWQVFPCLLLFWVFSALVSSNLLLYITTVQSSNSSEIRQITGYCDMLPSGQIIKWLFLILMAVRDIVFQGLMGWSSVYMVFRLCQHRKRVLHLHTSRLPGNASPETRAAQSILMLMACFLFFYWADFLFSFYIGTFWSNNYTVLFIKIYLTSGYASLSPFVLLSRDVRVEADPPTAGPAVPGPPTSPAAGLLARRPAGFSRGPRGAPAPKAEPKADTSFLGDREQGGRGATPKPAPSPELLPGTEAKLRPAPASPRTLLLSPRERRAGGFWATLEEIDERRKHHHLLFTCCQRHVTAASQPPLHPNDFYICNEVSPRGKVTLNLGRARIPPAQQVRRLTLPSPCSALCDKRLSAAQDCGVLPPPSGSQAVPPPSRSRVERGLGLPSHKVTTNHPLTHFTISPATFGDRALSRGSGVHHFFQGDPSGCFCERRPHPFLEENEQKARKLQDTERSCRHCLSASSLRPQAWAASAELPAPHLLHPKRPWPRSAGAPGAPPRPRGWAPIGSKDRGGAPRSRERVVT
ncbi:PREDICTED: uncharacterized protein LOC101631167 [Condylura cristata]|uniref:uncharacterized protein LOC101631167 n=1 Tax=Condylura cristata TaxID=143302 RepID=UPI000643C652|nr:PREDICTED: uncharacterized protein LOC101631167 [Condylura cristata]